MRKILVLFPNEWDHSELKKRSAQFEFLFEGFDVFKFPENAQLLTFSAQRFIEQLVSRYRHRHLSGVISTDEHCGSMIAAVVARRLGLPGADLVSILTAQHKFYSRQVQQQIAPEAVPRFSVFPYSIQSAADLACDFPFFVKPIRATYSIMARRVSCFAELKKHLTFAPLEKLVLRLLLRPFNDLIRAQTDFKVDAEYFIGEELIVGEHITVECAVGNGQITTLGVVDAAMFPGTDAFQRFEYPSNLPAAAQQRMRELAEQLIRGFGYEHGLFNVEFFYQPASGAIRIIEVNPRMAYQFADLYEKVDGFNTYDVLLSLCLGENIQLPRRQGRWRNSGSFVLRSFDGRALKTAPAAAEITRLQKQQPDARVIVYAKNGSSLAREMKWLGSYRYGLLNLGGMSRDDLYERYHQALTQLTFELE